METADITRWLASEQDYTRGVALYAAFGTSKAYHRLFALPATQYSRKVLLRELQALATSASAPATVATPALVPSFTQGPDPALVAVDDVLGLAALLLPLNARLRRIRDERSQTHAQLTTPGLRRTGRYQLASRILDLTEEEQDVLSDLAYVREHGRMPGPLPVAEVTDAGELRKRLGNLMSNRSKLRKQPAKADELAGIEADITLIREKLKTQSS